MENTTDNMPQFTAEDFIKSSKPYDWIVETADGNEFVQLQLVEQMSHVATELKVKKFKTMWESYIKAKNGQTLSWGNTMKFSGTAIELPTGEWIANDTGVFRIGSRGREDACPHPIFILSRYTNVDTESESLEIVYGRNGHDYKTKIVPRITLASQSKITKLAEYGVGVTSENAKNLVKYLSDFESINYDFIANQRSCDHLGWVGRGSDKFAPYIKDLTFEGEDSFRHLFRAVSPTGQYDTWLDLIRDYRKNGSLTVRILMAASFASALLKPLGALPFFVHLWGDSETGKSVALIAAVSVWADPTMGHYCYTFNSTGVGNERYASCLNSLPLCIDELQILNKKSDFDELIYTLCEGIGRVRGKVDGGIQKTLTWKNCILTTGEKPIVSAFSGGGAVNRVIEIECNSGKFFKNPREFCRIIQSHYGHAGKAFIERLTSDNNIAEARGLYERYIREIEKSSNATDKQTASAAAILTADELAEKWIFKDGIRITVDDIKPLLRTKEQMDVNRRAYEYLREEIIVNGAMFENKAPERWGIVKNGYIYILRNKFNAILQDGGFNPQSVLSWMARYQKLAKTDGKWHDVKVQIGNTRSRAICLYEDDGDYSDEDLNDEDLPFNV